MAEAQNHIVSSYEAELRQLRDLLTEMGGQVEAQVALAARAVGAHDAYAAARTIEGDRHIDELQRRIEAFVMRLLALRQPMASDLRGIVSSLRITAALERVGDYARNIAKRSLLLNEIGFNQPLSGITHMARLVQDNLRVVMDAVGEGDAVGAEAVWRSDEAVDDIYTAIFREFITYMMEDPRHITPCTHLLFVAKNLERIGDHATNIAETVFYAATGENLPEGRPRGSSPVAPEGAP